MAMAASPVYKPCVEARAYAVDNVREMDSSDVHLSSLRRHHPEVLIDRLTSLYNREEKGTTPAGV
eukprot:4197526-Pyramimonas_sp.AAC.1